MDEIQLKTKDTNTKRAGAIGLGMLFSITLAVSVLTPSDTAVADTIGETECFPAVLMLRGSGEPRLQVGSGGTVDYAPKSNSSTPYISTNGYEGNVLSRLLQEFVDQTDPAETVSKTRFVGIDYPAAPVFPELKSPAYPAEYESVGLENSIKAIGHVFDYNESYRAGAQKVKDFVKADQKRGCETQYTLMGYSQGVIAVRLALNLLDNNLDKIVSTYSIGDPFQKGSSTWSTKLKTLATTGAKTDSTIRGLASLLSLGSNPLVPANALIFALDEMTKSDAVIYNEGNTHSSRFLCHRGDPVCWSLAALDGTPDMAEHENYFDPAVSIGSAGYGDRLWEISEFDQQVQDLANSQPKNPRERTLQKTLSISGETTTYNVASSRPDDECRWDVDADGTFDFEASDFGPEEDSCSLNVVHSGSEAKMQVIVKDSFGLNHTLGSASIAVSPESPANATGLEEGAWYRFKPIANSGNSGLCFGPGSAIIPQNIYPSGFISPNGFDMARFESCDLGSDPQTVDNTKIFQIRYTASGNAYTVWGRDDDFALISAIGPSIGLAQIDQPLPSFAKIITPQIADTRNGVVHYKLRNTLNQCVVLSPSLDALASMPMGSCISANTRLFTAERVS